MRRAQSITKVIKQKHALLLDESQSPVLANEPFLSREVIAKLCPSCAEEMKRKNISGIKLSAIALDAMPEQLAKGLCNSLGDDPNFFTRCTEHDFGKLESQLGDKKGFCAWLHKKCLDRWPGEDKAKGLSEEEIKILGDDPGHPFHGNQWVSGLANANTQKSTARTYKAYDPVEEKEPRATPKIKKQVSHITVTKEDDGHTVSVTAHDLHSIEETHETDPKEAERLVEYFKKKYDTTRVKRYSEEGVELNEPSVQSLHVDAPVEIKDKEEDDEKKKKKEKEKQEYSSMVMDTGASEPEKGTFYGNQHVPGAAAKTVFKQLHHEASHAQDHASRKCDIPAHQIADRLHDIKLRADRAHEAGHISAGERERVHAKAHRGLSLLDKANGTTHFCDGSYKTKAMSDDAAALMLAADMPILTTGPTKNGYAITADILDEVLETFNPTDHTPVPIVSGPHVDGNGKPTVLQPLAWATSLYRKDVPLTSGKIKPWIFAKIKPVNAEAEQELDRALEEIKYNSPELQPEKCTKFQPEVYDPQHTENWPEEIAKKYVLKRINIVPNPAQFGQGAALLSDERGSYFIAEREDESAIISQQEETMAKDDEKTRDAGGAPPEGAAKLAEDVKCSDCGKMNASDADKCKDCGAKLPKKEQETSTTKRGKKMADEKSANDVNVMEILEAQAAQIKKLQEDGDAYRKASEEKITALTQEADMRRRQNRRMELDALCEKPFEQGGLLGVIVPANKDEFIQLAEFLDNPAKAKIGMRLGEDGKTMEDVVVNPKDALVHLMRQTPYALSSGTRLPIAFATKEEDEPTEQEAAKMFVIKKIAKKQGFALDEQGEFKNLKELDKAMALAEEQRPDLFDSRARKSNGGK